MSAHIILKRGKEESLLRSHPWIFSGAIQQLNGDPTEGDVVDVLTSNREFIARGHYQIGSITLRVLTFENVAIDQKWWNNKIAKAFRMRETLSLVDNSQTTCYRLVHGEGDTLPGLIIDIYGSTAVVQCHSVGMYHSREEICEALRNTYGSKLNAIYDKSSSTLPFNAGLNPVDQYIWGNQATHEADNNNLGARNFITQEDAGEEVMENGNRFNINWAKGQKTGFFIDQRENRQLVKQYAHGRKVLNTFCYTGGFSVYALAGGALHVDSVDSSQHAVDLVTANVELNFGPQVSHNSIAQDAFEFLKGIDNSYDLIILDPPAFAKHHKVTGNALQAYKRLNARAIQQIKPGGILFTFSCSQAVNRDQFRMAVFSAAAIAGRKVRILHQMTQPADHPINIYHPEGEYLKGLVLYIE